MAGLEAVEVVSLIAHFSRIPIFNEVHLDAIGLSRLVLPYGPQRHREQLPRRVCSALITYLTLNYLTPFL